MLRVPFSRKLTDNVFKINRHHDLELLPCVGLMITSMVIVRKSNRWLDDDCSAS